MREAILSALIAAAGVTGWASMPADRQAAPEAVEAATGRAALEPSHVWAAVNSRSSYVPSRNLVIDGCALDEVIGTDAAQEVRQRLPQFTFAECGEPRPDGATVWGIAGAMEWSGGRRVALAVDVTTASTFHRETYLLDDGRVEEIVLDGFGHYQQSLPPPPPRN